MDNQHQKIKGYRDLSQAEIDLMNEIKEEGERLKLLIEKVDAHLVAQRKTAEICPVLQEQPVSADPFRWLAMARTDLQIGTMKLVRAVAQPESF